MKALNLSGGETPLCRHYVLAPRTFLRAAAVFKGQRNESIAGETTASRGLLRGRELHRRKWPTQRSNPLKLDNNAKRSIKRLHWSRVITRLACVHVAISYRSDRMNYWELRCLEGCAHNSESCPASDGGPTWCNVWAQKKDTPLNQQLLHH